MLLSLIITNFSFSQNDNTSPENIDTLNIDSIEIDPVFYRLKLAFNYSSANTFLGRKDSISIPLLSPMVKFTFANNLYLQTSLVHTNTTTKIFDELDSKIGYRHFLGDHLDGAISYTHYFFNPSVTRLNSLVNNDVNLYFGYDMNFLYSSISLDYSYGSQSSTITSKKNSKEKIIKELSRDITVSWMNMRQFYFYELFSTTDKLIFTPEIDILLGTQNSIHLYKKKIKPTKMFSSFNPKAINVNIDLLYVKKRLSINLSPYATFPLNVSLGESSKPYFVIYGGVFYTWKWEKKKKH